ncbi:MAG TPA: acyltransferase [Candidatus Sulfotelmatobacter sp.]|jgi:peptidoglycan/LPS O-acetylase OafA/YrhL|nr:acyltransferase [Candidatus Sulfotelmatobacter sp.]
MLTLDGLRGIAAFCVMTYHFKGSIDTGLFFPKSYLAVDLFFLMSGLVIARSYENNLISGKLTLPSFIWKRFLRLWPLYIGGTALLAAYFIVRNHLSPAERIDEIKVLETFAVSFFFLPQFLWPQSYFGTASTGLYPLNPAAWSLGLELLANLVYGIAYFRMSNKCLLAIVGTAAACLALAGLEKDSLDFGSSLKSIDLGTLRILFSFTLGVLFHRWLRDGVFSVGSRLPSPGVLMLLGTALLVVPAPAEGVISAVFDMACVFILFPALVWAAAQTEPKAKWAAFSALSGRTSYAIYILHGPCFMVLAGLGKILFHAAPEQLKPYSGLSFAAIVLLASYAATRWYDEPFRNLASQIIRSLKAEKPVAVDAAEGMREEA